MLILNQKLIFIANEKEIIMTRKLNEEFTFKTYRVCAQVGTMP